MPSSSRLVDSHVQPYRTSSDARSANAASARSISSREGTSKVRSISSGTHAEQDGSSAIRLLWSYSSYSRVPGSLGASGFVQLIRRSKIGSRLNMPPGPSSADTTAWWTPSRESA